MPAERPVALTVLLLAAGLAGCSSPSGDGPGDQVEPLDAFKTCRLTTPEDEPLCEFEIGARPVEDLPGEAWECRTEGGNWDGAFGFRIHRSDDGSWGVSFNLGQPVDDLAAWLVLNTAEDRVALNASTERTTGFVSFPNATTPAEQNVSVKGIVVASNYTTNASTLQEARKDAVIVPGFQGIYRPAESNANLVHRFRADDATYYFKRSALKDVHVEGEGFFVDIAVAPLGIDAEGDGLGPGGC